MSENTYSHLNLLFTIVDRDMGNKVAKIFNSINIGSSYILLGTGTANSEILDYFGIGETAKDIVITPLKADKVNEVFDELNNKLQLNKPGRGISFTIPMASIAGIQTYKILSGVVNNEDNGVKNEKMKNDMPQQYNYNLIITIVNQGSVDSIMDAAKEAGATGGTILHGRGAGLKDSETFLGISIQPEKDLLLIVAKTEDKQKIMKAISKSAEFSEENRSLTFSLPVDNLAGISRLMK